MAWYNPFSWSDKAVDNVLDKDKGLLAQVGSWVGNMNLTKEEVIEFNAKTVSSVQSFVKATLSESTERSKTRRAIAVLWIKTQLAIVLMCCIAAPFDLELAKFYFDLATSTLMITVTTAICIFFFGSHGIARHNETKK
jgi:F0F1-type ATP synthase membrane subunit a